MALQKFANNAQGTLLATITASAASFQLQSGEGAEFPALGFGEYCYVRIGSDSSNEVVKVTARSSDTFTCVPTINGWVSGTPVTLTVSAELMRGLAQNNDLAVYGMAIARMRGAGPSSSGVILASGDITVDSDLKVVAQSTPNMSVVVKAGACIVLGVFTGTSIDVTVAIAAPTVNNRITILQINQDGVITAKHGTEATSPVAPTVDANNYKLGQVLLGITATDIENADCTDNRNAI